MILPVATVICGRAHESIYTAIFSYQEDNQGNGSIDIESLTSEDSLGNVYDILYLINEGTGSIDGLDTTIVTTILYNSANWDNNEPWW